MTPADRAAFDEGLRALEALFGWRIPAAVRPLYGRALEELPLEAALGGVDLLIRHFRSEHGRFPRPGDLRYYAVLFASDHQRNLPRLEPRELTDEEQADILASIRHLRAALEDADRRRP